MIVVDANSTSETLEQIYNMQPNDVMIGITFPRYSKRTMIALQFAKDHGAKTIALSRTTRRRRSWSSRTAACLPESDVMTIVDSLVCALSVVNALVTAIALLA